MGNFPTWSQFFVTVVLYSNACLGFFFQPVILCSSPGAGCQDSGTVVKEWVLHESLVAKVLV